MFFGIVIVGLSVSMDVILAFLHFYTVCLPSGSEEKREWPESDSSVIILMALPRQHEA